MPIPFLAPLAPLFVAIFKLILLGSLKFAVLLIGMFIALVWTERKLRQFTYGAAHHGLEALYVSGKIPDDDWLVVDGAINSALSEEYMPSEARAILKKKLLDTAASVWLGIKEIPRDVCATASALRRWAKKFF